MRWLIIILSGLAILALLEVGAAWFFYMEEDARGVREWNLTKQKLQAMGESVN